MQIKSINHLFNKPTLRLQESHIIHKILKPTIAVILPFSMMQCSDSRLSEKENIDNIKVEFFQVKPKTKNYIEQSIRQFKNVTSNTKFLEDVSIDVTKNYNELDDCNSFRRYLKQGEISEDVNGCSYYSDYTIPKKIVIQEDSHSNQKIVGYFSGCDLSFDKSLKFSLMHEVGHQFDKFYGHNHNSDLARKWENYLHKTAVEDSLRVYKPSIDDNYISLKIKYNAEDGLSDKKDFKRAFLMDLKNIQKLKNSSSDDLAYNIDYFLSGIDFSKDINEKSVNVYDRARSEVYANLFAYSVGEDNGDGKRFVSLFKNSYDVVYNDVKNLIGLKR